MGSELTKKIGDSSPVLPNVASKNYKETIFLITEFHNMFQCGKKRNWLKARVGGAGKDNKGPCQVLLQSTLLKGPVMVHTGARGSVTLRNYHVGNKTFGLL